MCQTFIIRKNHEWARFFVHESPPMTMRDNTQSYSATWCCLSSFGVFGHTWSSMGEPFVDFIQGVSADYLLSKIARKVPDAEKTCAEIRRLVLQARLDDRITKQEAKAAWDDIASAEEEGNHPEVVFHELYWSVAISKVGIEWCDLSTQVWDSQAVRFVELLWPEFVKFVTERPAVPA